MCVCVCDLFVFGPRIKFCALAQTWVVTHSLVSEKRIDWFTLWWFIMFVPRIEIQITMSTTNQQLGCPPPREMAADDGDAAVAVAAIGVVRLERGRGISHKDQGHQRCRPERGCDNIHSWISTIGDLASSHQQEFTVLNSQKGYWRSLPEISLFSLFSLFY